MTEVLDSPDVTATQPLVIPPGSVDPRSGDPLSPVGPDGAVIQPSPDSNASPPTVPFPVVTGTGEGGDPSTQPTAEEAHEAAVIHTDRELLHGSHRLKQKIEDIGVKTVGRWQRLKARVGNALEPGEKGLKRRRDRAEKALAAREGYQNKARSGVVRDTRQSSVDIARTNLAYRERALTNRNYRIEQRKAYVNTKVLIREKRRDEALQHVREKVEVARGRKALRQELLTDVSKREAREIVRQKIKPETLHRVGNALLSEEASLRTRTQAEYDQQAADGRLQATNSGIVRARRGIAQLTREYTDAPTRIGNLERALEVAGQAVSRLEADLGHPPGPEDSAEYADQYAVLQSGLQSARLQVENYEEQLRDQRDINDNHPARLTEMNDLLTRLSKVLPVHSQQAEAARRTADARRAQHVTQQTNRDRLIRQTLRIDESEEIKNNGTTN